MDFENVLLEDWVGMIVFVMLFVVLLYVIGVIVLVDVFFDLGMDWIDVFDYVMFGVVFDYMVFMGYEEYWNGDFIVGLVVLFFWVENVLDIMFIDVVCVKVILVFLFYIRDWLLVSLVIGLWDIIFVE